MALTTSTHSPSTGPTPHVSGARRRRVAVIAAAVLAVLVAVRGAVLVAVAAAVAAAVAVAALRPPRYVVVPRLEAVVIAGAFLVVSSAAVAGVFHR